MGHYLESLPEKTGEGEIAMKGYLKYILLGFLSIFLVFSNNILAQKEDPRNPDWKKYHNTEESHTLLEGWADTFPNLTSLYSIGKTLKGTPLMVLEITNKKTGAALDKPGYYYDGNIHAGELTAAEVALHFAWHLLKNYGQDARITRLIDTHTLYIRPKFNPDGADLAMTNLHNLRSTPRPYDEDRDGILDEDPPNDLNKDGFITLMRVKNPNGLWTISPEDGRIMVRRDEKNQTGKFYNLYSEGIDDDEDGYFNEDDVGGIDMNRNFTRNWGMEFQQRGAGPYPLSEPETRVTIEFFHSHRNITGVFHGHTSGGFLFRLPSTTSWDNFELADQRLILELSEKYHQTTGQPVSPSYSNPRIHRYGTLISWAYWDYGIVGSVPEFWGGFGRDYDRDGRITEAERMHWNEEELKGQGFTDWDLFNHPQLGQVEIGGWRTRFTRQNPPPHLLRSELELYIPWMLWLAEISPRVVIKDISVKPVDSKDVVKITVTVENEGYLSTNITQRAIEARVDSPVRAAVSLKNAKLIGGGNHTNLGHLKGSRDTQGRAGIAESRYMLEYLVLKTGSDPVFTVTVGCEKGGVVRREIRLK